MQNTVPPENIFAQVQQQMAELFFGSAKAYPLLSLVNKIEYKETQNSVVYSDVNVRLLHYGSHSRKRNRTPILIVYAMINRYQILDVENKSVIKQLLDNGFDVYLIDWGTTSDPNSKMKINDYVNNYMDKCVDIVRNNSGCDKVTLLGYCMGGTFSTIYTSLHSEKVKNLVTVAPPIDSSKDTTVFGTFAKHLDVDTIVDTVGNIPPTLQHFFFLMLKPFKHYVEKYNQVVERSQDDIYLKNFLYSEKWLWDTPPIPGEVFRQWVKDVYQKNLLAKNRLRVGGAHINLQDIDTPLLNVVAEFDHLVSPNSSKVLNDLVGSKDKSLMSFQTGHTGLCASEFSQKEVWPRIIGWLADRS